MNNYDIIVEESKKRFLQWDQNKMIEKYSLRADSESVSYTHLMAILEGMIFG